MTTVGPYRIVRELGGGGMGVVYEAADDALNRTVALKLISPHLAEDEAFRARFTREAQALAALDSPHVVHVYAHGEVDGQLYIATQLIPDGDLGGMLQQFGAPPVRIAVDLVAQVAAGLADAHEAGMVHRDIKPANILLRRRGSAMSAYLGDFGIARNLSAEATHASRTGTVGTPSYMPPELHTGGEAGIATDLYSVGCLLWATLTGHAPYRGTTDYQVVTAHLEAPIPQLPETTPLNTEVNRILRTAMAKDPADRYPSAAHLRDDLRRARSLPDGSRARTPHADPASRRPTALLAACVALLLALVVGGIAWAVGGDGEPPPGSTAPAPTAPVPSPSGSGDPGEAGAGDARAAAEDSLADALEAQGLLTREQAECTAAGWIDAAGLDAMVAEGLFDSDYAFVDVPAASMSEDMRAAAASATVACVGG